MFINQNTHTHMSNQLEENSVNAHVLVIVDDMETATNPLNPASEIISDFRNPSEAYSENIKVAKCCVTIIRVLIVTICLSFSIALIIFAIVIILGHLLAR